MPAKKNENEELEKALNDEEESVPEEEVQEEVEVEVVDSDPEYVEPESGIDGPTLGNAPPISKEEADRLSQIDAEKAESE